MFGKKVPKSQIVEEGEETKNENARTEGTKIEEGNSSFKILKQEERDEKVFQDVIDYFITKESKLMSQINSENGEIGEKKERVRSTAKEQFELRVEDTDRVERLTRRFESYIWGFYVLDELIEDPEVSDIKCYSDQRVRVKKNGKRYSTKVRFLDLEDYNRFIQCVCVRNKVNLSAINAQVKFMDNKSSPNFRLRFDVSNGMINSSGIPSLHIRKRAKRKYGMEDLEKLGYCSTAERKLICERFQAGDGILFTGANGSGKTYGLDALIEEFPEHKSALIIQETDEISSGHPDILLQHVIENNGESKISYGLNHLANFGLVGDYDMFVLGEVKSGQDAASIPMIAATGSQFLLTGHGNNEMDAIYKVADYMKQSTGYDLDQCLKFLAGIKLVVYVENFHVAGMSQITGWNYKENRLEIQKLELKPQRVASISSLKKHPRKKEPETDIMDFIMPARAIND